MVHIALAVLGADAVDDLLFRHRRERRDGHDLRLATGEHAGAMGARQHADFAPDRANLRQLAAVGTHALVDDVAAHDFLLDGVQRVADLGLAALERLSEVLADLGLDLLLAGVALRAVEGLEHPLNLVVGVLAHGLLDVVARKLQRELLLRLADFRDDAAYEFDDLLHFFMGKQDAAEHDFLGDFLRARLDHQHGLGRAGDGQVHQRNLALRDGGVDDVLAVDIADVDRADRAGPRNLRNRQRGGGADHRRDVRRVVLLDGHDGRDDGHIVAHSLREQRAQRAVDQAGGQDGLLRRTALAAVPRTGNVAHGIEFFLKVHAQREEVDARARGVGDGGVDQHAGVAIADEGRAAGLFGVLSEFQRERAAAQLHRIALEHVLPSLWVLSMDIFILKRNQVREIRQNSETARSPSENSLKRASGVLSAGSGKERPLSERLSRGFLAKASKTPRNCAFPFQIASARPACRLSRGGTGKLCFPSFARRRAPAEHFFRILASARAHARPLRGGNKCGTVRFPSVQ